MREISLPKKLEANEMEFFTLHRSERKVTPKYSVLRSVVKDVPLWNFAGVISCEAAQAESLISEIEDFFLARSIKPAFRITPWTAPQNFENLIASKNYSPVLELSTMTYQNDFAGLALSDKIKVRGARTDSEIEKFTELQLLGFSGTLEGKEWYLETNRRNSQRRDHKYYIGYYGDKAAGVCQTLNHPQEVIGIYGVTTLEQYREKGVARALIQRVIRDAAESGVTNITLATALNGPAELAFKKLGFTRAFESKIYQLKSTGGST